MLACKRFCASQNLPVRLRCVYAEEREKTHLDLIVQLDKVARALEDCGCLQASINGMPAARGPP